MNNNSDRLIDEIKDQLHEDCFHDIGIWKARAVKHLENTQRFCRRVQIFAITSMIFSLVSLSLAISVLWRAWSRPKPAETPQIVQPAAPIILEE